MTLQRLFCIRCAAATIRLSSLLVYNRNDWPIIQVHWLAMIWTHTCIQSVRSQLQFNWNTSIGRCTCGLTGKFNGNSLLMDYVQTICIRVVCGMGRGFPQISSEFGRASERKIFLSRFDMIKKQMPLIRHIRVMARINLTTRIRTSQIHGRWSVSTLRNK